MFSFYSIPHGAFTTFFTFYAPLSKKKLPPIKSSHCPGRKVNVGANIYCLRKKIVGPLEPNVVIQTWPGKGNDVSVLWREEGYTVKYSLSTREIPRDFPRAQAIFHGISQLETKCRHSQFMIIILSVMSFLVGQYCKSWFSLLVWQLGYIFLYCPVDEAIWVHIDPVENSVVAAQDVLTCIN